MQVARRIKHMTLVLIYIRETIKLKVKVDRERPIIILKQFLIEKNEKKRRTKKTQTLLFGWVNCHGDYSWISQIKLASETVMKQILRDDLRECQKWEW